MATAGVLCSDASSDEEECELRKQRKQLQREKRKKDIRKKLKRLEEQVDCTTSEVERKDGESKESQKSMTHDTESSVWMDELNKASSENVEILGSVTSSVGQKKSELQASTSAILWDRYNLGEQEIVCQSVKYKTLLQKKLSELTEWLQPMIMIPYLKQLEVIDRKIQERLLLNATRADVTDRLVDYLEIGPCWRLHGFLRALALTEQQHIITLLGLNSTDYEDPKTESQPSQGKQIRSKPHYYKRIENNEILHISNDLLPGLLQHCGSYDKTLLKSSLFGRKGTIPIDLKQVYVRTNAQYWKTKRTCENIGKMELFLTLFQRHPPNSVSLEGPAGAGKSSFMQEYAFEWSKDITSCEKRGTEVQCQGHLWKLIVYIQVGCIRGTLIDAIKANLKCEPNLKEQMMAAIKEDGEGVLIIGDGIDELRNQASIESLCEFTKTSQEMVGKPTIFISARNGLLSIPIQHFDRKLHIKGFSIEQGVQYMEQYFKEIHEITHHPVLDYARTHPGELRWVLVNPLQVHILSELTASGFLSLEEVHTLTTVKLFRCLDHHMVARDEECRGVNVASADFYQVCLRCLLNDKRQITEDEISSGSPYLSLLTTSTYRNQDYNECHMFGFPHEMVFEFFAMRGLIDHIKSHPENKKLLLLYLSSNPNMWNVLQMACGFIIQYERKLFPDTVVAIIRCCLLLQTKIEPCVKNKLTIELPKLQNNVQESFSRDVLSSPPTSEQRTKMDTMYDLIQDMFDHETGDCLKMFGWAPPKAKQLFWGDGPFHRFIFACLEQCTSEERAEICMQTTHHLFPCAMHDQQPLYSSYIRPVNGRYATAQTRGKTVLEINVHCPQDLEPTLHSPEQLYDLQSTNEQYRQLEIQNLNLVCQYETITLWVNRSVSIMCHPDGGWSAGEWTPGLRKLLQQHGISRLNIHPGPHVSLSGLLLACQEVITHGHKLTEGLNIMLGKVSSEDLLQFLDWAHGVGLGARLGDLTVSLSAQHDPDLWQDVDSIIRHKICSEAVYRPTYVATSGKVLCEKYKLQKMYKVR